MRSYENANNYNQIHEISIPFRCDEKPCFWQAISIQIYCFKAFYLLIFQLNVVDRQLYVFTRFSTTALKRLFLGFQYVKELFMLVLSVNNLHRQLSGIYRKLSIELFSFLFINQGKNQTVY